MDVLKIFMKELYDFEMTDAQVSIYTDPNTNSLKMGAIMKDKLLHSNLIFRHLWRSITGVYPPRIIGMMFMTQSNRDNYTLQDIIKLLTFVNPVYGFIKLDIATLENVFKDFSISLQNDVANVKKALVMKFAYRYGLEPTEIDMSQSIFNIFRMCIFNETSLRKLTNICNQFEKIIDTPNPIMFNPEIKSVKDYFEQSQQIILTYELNTKNIFNDYSNNILKLDNNESQITIYDAINLSCLMDGEFYRFLTGSISIYINSNSISFNDIQYLIKSTDEETSKNIVIFCNVDNTPYEINHSTYHIIYKVLDPYLLNFVPKVVDTFILVGNTIRPESTILSINTIKSLYYYLPNSELDKIELNHKKHPYLISRYIVPSLEIANQLYPVQSILLEHPISIHTIPNKEHKLIDNEFIEHQWKAQLTSGCPYQTFNTPLYSTRFNVTLYDQFLLRYTHENPEVFDFPTSSKNAKNCVVMIDNRENLFSVLSLFITMYNLDPSLWHPIVVCNDHNYEFFKHYLGDKVTYIKKFVLPKKKFAIEIYNDLLKNPHFWESFMDYEKILFVQDDGMIVKKGMEEKFLQYDYVGGPWRKEWAVENPNKFLLEKINPNLIGNGGVSLRNVKLMKSFCEKYKHLTKQLHYDRIQQQPEDVFFSYCSFKEKSLLPSYEEAQLFSSEQVINDNETAFGFHKTWVYHGLPDIIKMFNNYLHVEKLPMKK
jgi:hypothetical protein